MKKKNNNKNRLRQVLNQAVKREPICRNCLLYDFHKQHCKVVVLYDGEKINPPTSPNDHCLFDTEFQSVDKDGNVDNWVPELQEVKWWVENPHTGQKAKQGVVKIEYPVGFFGSEKDIFEADKEEK